MTRARFEMQGARVALTLLVVASWVEGERLHLAIFVAALMVTTAIVGAADELRKGGGEQDR